MIAHLLAFAAAKERNYRVDVSACTLDTAEAFLSRRCIIPLSPDKTKKSSTGFYITYVTARAEGER